ncbi:MAG: PrsW family glutamic-type intramembrane protease [Anaerolineales bacterium]|nr:PrsW family glutamic-type intramembrane protease [Anaerolineales bacterium]
MQTNKTHWSSILTLVVFCIGILSLLLIAFSLGISSVFGLFSGDGDPAAKTIGAFALGFESLVLLVCSWFVLQKTMRREQADLPLKLPFASWQIFAVIGLVIFSMAVGGVVAVTEITWLGWLMLPSLTLLVIVPPIWMFFGIGTNGIDIGARWRFFSILGLSMTVAPVIMVVLEILLLLGIVIGAAILIGITQPELLQQFSHLFSLIEFETDQQVILSLLSPYITNPIAIAAGMGYIAVVVPLIEELLKPLAVWLFAGKIESPAQGFALGIISGAGFALVESLNASADSTISWPVIVSVRAGTSLLHMTVSGLVGWGIVSAFKEKRIGRLFAAYFTAVLIHGVWNACAAGAGLSAIGESIGKPEWLSNFAPALICGLLVLGIGMFAVLLASNRKLRNALVTTMDLES